MSQLADTALIHQKLFSGIFQRLEQTPPLSLHGANGRNA